MTWHVTKSELRMLRDIRDHGNPYYSCRGRPSRIDARETRYALRFHDLINADDTLTELGAAELRRHDGKQEASQ